MKIAAAGDFHSAERIEDFGRELREYSDLDLAVLLGDLFPKKNDNDVLDKIQTEINEREEDIERSIEVLEAAVDLEERMNFPYLILPGNWDVEAKELDQRVEEYVGSFEDPGVFRYREDLNLEKDETPHSLRLPEYNIHFVHGGFGDQTPYTDNPEHLDLNNNFFDEGGILWESIEQNRREIGEGLLIKGHDHDSALVHSDGREHNVYYPENEAEFKLERPAFYSVIPGRENMALIEEDESEWSVEFVEY